MTIKYNTVSSIGQGITWLKLGWQLFKKQPITWGVMALIVTIISIIGATSTVGRFVISLLTPVLIGGVALTMDRAARDETVQLEGLFAAFKNKPMLKQLLLVGSIGMAVTAFSTLASSMPAIEGLSRFATLIWLLALVFAIPLVAIQQQPAVAALKSSLWVSVVHLFSIVPFVIMVAVLAVLAVLPAGLGLLVLLPVLYCSLYCAFAMIYPSAERTGQAEESQEILAAVSETQPEVTPALSAASTMSPQEHIEQIVEKHLAIAHQQESIKATEVALPKNLTINYYDDYVHITRRWLTARSIFGGVVSLTATLGIYYLFTSQSASFNSSGEQWFLVLLPWLTALFTLLGCYYLAAQCLNQTNIYASAATVQIEHRPLPWFGNKRLEAANLKQLFVRQRVTRSDNRTNVSYDIEMVARTGTTSCLISGLKSDQQALFIEQELERFLKIENEPVPGSFS